jgi:antitoxin component of MazEF toxin-antitoxin module
MHTTNLRKVGGSVMLAVPRAILDLLHLEAGATVGLAVDAWSSCRNRSRDTQSMNCWRNVTLSLQSQKRIVRGSIWTREAGSYEARRYLPGLARSDPGT